MSSYDMVPGQPRKRRGALIGGARIAQDPARTAPPRVTIGAGRGAGGSAAQPVAPTVATRLAAGPPVPARPSAGKVAKAAVGGADKGLSELLGAVDIPDTFIGLASVIQQLDGIGSGVAASAVNTVGDISSISVASGAFGVAGGVQGSIKGVVGIGKGSSRVHRARKAEHGSLDLNLGAQQIEDGITGFVGGGFGTSTSVASLAKEFGAQNIPGIDVAANYTQAALKGKKGIEDAVAAEKLRRQGNKAKHEADHHLADDVRVARLTQFMEQFEAYKQARDERDSASGWDFVRAKARTMKLRAGFKSGDIERYEQAYFDLEKQGSALTVDALLDHLKTGNIKEFGKGTKHRDAYDKAVAEGTATSTATYDDARSLKKFAKFGHRRKAETATVNSVEAVGHALDATGTFTAGGDLGATKATGKLIKGLSGAYKALKEKTKHARRVHKLRKAKNELSYGGKSDRGFLWGAKVFFGSDVSGSQDKVRDAITSGGQAAGNSKRVDLTNKSPKDIARLVKMLTIQAKRRTADFVRCLGSTNDQVFHRAGAILHVVAETNLAGAIARVKDADIVEYRRLSQLVASGGASEDEAKKHKTMTKAIEGIVSKQLSGIGG
ncbi:MAG: hypothetical protein JJT89_04700 [Nitriliruptoraceae bacterium]|nr:hypothetical protein [Nitriliruptoraceae bacterium]